MPDRRSILITGACGYVGRELIRELIGPQYANYRLIALDVHADPGLPSAPNLEYLALDIRSPEIATLLRRARVDTVVHLASIVNPGRNQDEAFAYSVDVEGTRNLLGACVENGVGHLIVTSSGAAYGYHADSPRPLHEGDALRGNDEFAYSRHKRLVEEMLASYRDRHPELKQLIFRPGTILGANVSNQITNLFERRAVPGVFGCDSPFVLIWDRDVIRCILHGIDTRAEGIYNLAGDGALPMREIARLLGKPYLPIPAFVLRAALFVLHALGLSRYGPEQVRFLMYRPVLSNDKLKAEFGYRPEMTTREVFDFYLKSRREHGVA